MPKQRRRNKTEYGIQFEEKQKLRNSYGLRERQFHNYFKKSETAEDVFQLLEARLDSTVYRLGFAMTLPAARQLVGHGHVMINGRKTTVPSYQVRPHDHISIRPGSMQKGVFADLDERLKKHQTFSWLSLDKEKKEGAIVSKASLQEIGSDINIRLVIEFYNR